MHLNSRNLTDQVFNNLTAQYPVSKPATSKNKDGGTYWLCKCTCGNEKIVRAKELKTGDIKSCGCLNKFQNNSKYKGVGLIAQSVYSHIQWGANKRNIEFNISKEYLWDLYQFQEGKCYYTGLDISLNTRNNIKTASLDRIDSTKGYIEGNVKWVHKRINIMKNIFSHDEFINTCKLISLRFSESPKIKGNSKLSEDNCENNEIND